MDAAGRRAYRIDDFEIEETQGTVFRIHDGQEIYLRPQVFKVLAFLIRERGRTISKHELLDTFWKDTPVTEDALVQCILDIRKVLGDDSRHPRFIRTLPKVGYRFIGTVQEHFIPAPDARTTRIEVEDTVTVEYEYSGRKLPSIQRLEDFDAVSPMNGQVDVTAAGPSITRALGRPKLLVATLASLLLLAASGFWIYTLPAPPVSAVLRGSNIEVKDTQGRICWTRELPLISPTPRWDLRGTREERFLIDDIDRDGRTEVVVNFVPAYRSDARARLICYEEDGRLRWESPLGRVKSYEGRTFNEEYFGRMLRLVHDQRRTYLLTISSHLLWYPTQVALLDPSSGSLIEEYWHPGSLSHCLLQDLDGDGVQEVLLLGLNNPGTGLGHAAFLALKVPFSAVPRKNVGPFAGFTGGLELAYVLFPRSDISFVEGLIEPAYHFEVVPPDRILIQLMVKEGERGSQLYTFDYFFRLVDFRISDSLPPIHDRLEHEGVLDHPLSEREIACLGKILFFPTAPDGNSPELNKYWADCEHGLPREAR